MSALTCDSTLHCFLRSPLPLTGFHTGFSVWGGGGGGMCLWVNLDGGMGSILFCRSPRMVLTALWFHFYFSHMKMIQTRNACL